MSSRAVSRRLQLDRMVPITHGMRSGPLKIGQDFGPRYHVLKLLGSGGMGVVYQALDRELGEDIALKVLRAPARQAAAGSLAEMQRRFRAELVLARKVTHKHVIRIHDIGEIDGIKFISMPLVKGRDLAAILGSGPLPVERALHYARQMIAGLMAVHAAGVVHRDLKPSNIMIGENDQVLLMDFGIARANAPAGQPRTIAGAIVGTTAYMAPEQARGETVDHRTDVYGFGLILYEMLCGTRPNLTIAELLARMKAVPTPPRQLNPAVPAELDAIVTRCLKPAAAERYQTSADVGAALSGFKRGRKRRRSIPALPIQAWLPRMAAGLVVGVLAALTYWLFTTPHGARAVEAGRQIASRSLDRISQLNPSGLLARDTPVGPEGPPAPAPVHASPREGMAAPREPVRAAFAPPLLDRDRQQEGRRAAPRPPGAEPQVEAAAPGQIVIRPYEARPTRPAMMSATPSTTVDAARLLDRTNPSVAAAAAPARRSPDAASTAGTLDAWLAPAAATPARFVLPARQAAAAAAPSLVVATRTPEAARGQTPQQSEHWLDRILPVRRYRMPMPADADAEFQICYLPPRTDASR